RLFSSWSKSEGRKYTSEQVRIGGLVPIELLEEESTANNRRKSTSRVGRDTNL
ncbi:hypothetical protein LTS18_013018, partial [Coniosporium uncinatum]